MSEPTITPEQFDAILELLPDWSKVEDIAFHNQSYIQQIPESTMEGLRNYLYEGVPCGNFLSAVIDNDLTEALGRADSDNRKALHSIVGLVYNEFPLISRDRQQWLDLHSRKRSSAQS